MAHWFDDVARGVATYGFSRRGAMALLSRAGIVGTSVRLTLIDRAEAQPRPVSPPTTTVTQGPCTFVTDPEKQLLRFQASASVFGRRIILSKSITQMRGRVGGTTVSHSYTIDGSSFLQIVATRSDFPNRPGFQINIIVQFAQGVSGIRQLILTSTDGSHYSGSADGRPIRPFDIHAPSPALAFQDGRPAPQASVNLVSIAAFEAVLRGAPQQAVTCSSPAVPAARIEDLQVPDTGRSDNTHGTKSCLGCLGGCVGTAALGSAAAAALGTGIAACCAASLGFGCAVCVALAAAAIAAAELTCSHFCEISRDCCPVMCGEVACCYGGDTCLDQNRGVCCGPNRTPCHSRECCGSDETCLPNGTCCSPSQICNNVCCPSGQNCSNEGICCPQSQSNVQPISCRGICCGPGEVCKDGVTCCTPNDPVCHGVCCRGGFCDPDGNCCAPPSHNCAGQCCAPLSTCCGNQCCGDICVENICCPSERLCGNTCCPPGHICQDGTCSACAPTLVPCSSIGPNGVFSICCPLGAICCGGQCCDPRTTEICQFDENGAEKCGGTLH